MEDFPGDAAVGGLAYDADTGTICLAMNGQVYRSANGADFEAIASVSTDSLMGETPAWILPDGRYALWLDGVHICAAGAGQVNVQLVMQGYASIELGNAFAEAYPNITLVQEDPVNGSEELAQKILTKDSSTDIFVLKADYAYTALINKGLAADLSSSNILTKDVDSMDETIQSVLKNSEGRVVAYPYNLSIWYYGVSEGYWNMAFGDRPLPTTFDEVLDAWIEWEKDDADEYPGVGFVDSFDYATWCRNLITTYVMQHDSSDASPDLTDPALKNVLEKLEQVYEIRKAAGRSTSLDDPNELDEYSGETGPGMVFWMINEDAMHDFSSLSAAPSEAYLYGVRKGEMTWIPLVFKRGGRTDGQWYAVCLCGEPLLRAHLGGDSIS